MVQDNSSRLLALVPRELAHSLKPHSSPITAAILDEVRTTVPVYAEQLNGPRGKVLAGTVERAITHYLECLEDPKKSTTEWTEFIRRRGGEEFHHGRTTDALQAAARVGGRVAWRYLAPILRRHGLSLDKLSLTAEAIFAYVDELSSAAVTGYLDAQARATGVSELRKRQLLELILTAPHSTQPSIATLASVVDWTLPSSVAMIALANTEQQATFPANMLDCDVLVDLESDEPYLLSADPQRHVAELGGSVRGWRIAVSPAVPLDEAAAALRMARRALQLIRPGETEATIWCEQHLANLWLRAEDFLAGEIAKRSLGPLDGLTDKQHERLCETLLAWLETRGGAPEIARRLELHPQTVRARMHQIEHLFGSALDDAEARLAIQLALRAQQAQT